MLLEQRRGEIGLRGELRELRCFEIVRLQANHVIARDGIGFGVYVDLPCANTSGLRIDQILERTGCTRPPESAISAPLPPASK